MRNSLYTAVRSAALLPVALLTVFLAGCGGGGGGGPVGGSKAPTAATRAAVRKVQKFSLHALANGAPTASALGSINTGVGNGVGSVNGNAQGLASLGGYLNNANSSAANSNHRSIKIHRTRDVSATRFYNEWLQLWEEDTNTDTSSSQKFFVDEAGTQAAGSITSSFSADGVWPYVSTYDYNFTAGALQGTHGTSHWEAHEDGSSKSSYSSVTSDGWKYQGQTTTTKDGVSAWTNQTDGPDGSATDSGTFRPDGSGTTHSQSSDGYVVDYTYNADGTATGKISGPAPGLPATVTIDATGQTTIRYADGTTETIPGWDALYNGTTSSGGDSGNSGSDSGNSGNTSGGGSPPTAP